MSKTEESHVRVVLLEGKVYEKLPDGVLKPMRGETDWDRLDRMTEEEIEAAAWSDPDALPMTDEEWATAEVVRPTKVPVGLKLDSDVLGWFKARGKGYQTRINAVLRRYVEAQEKRAGLDDKTSSQHKKAG